MKKLIVAAAIIFFSIQLNAQSIQDGIKMYKFERYESAEKILTPLATGNAMANYYLGLSQLELGKVADAKTTFAKFPEDPANMAGMARVAYAQNNAALGNQLA